MENLNENVIKIADKIPSINLTLNNNSSHNNSINNLNIDEIFNEISEEVASAWEV
jgi:hypothetical protein